jgi:hypothetical protein
MRIRLFKSKKRSRWKSWKFQIKRTKDKIEKLDAIVNPDEEPEPAPPSDTEPSWWERWQQDQAEKKEAKAYAKAEKALEKEQRKQADQYAKMIPAALRNLKLASTTRQPGRSGQRDRIIVNMIKIRPPVLINRDYYMYQIDTKRLPHGVTISQLMSDEIVETLSFALGTPVVAEGNPNHGFWYLVPRVGGLGIIPRKIDWEECISKLPKRAGTWAFVVGMGPNKTLTWIDIRKKIHMLIAGTTGSGKSVMIKNIIISIALHNSPHRARFIICDFKMGADYIPLLKLPHVGTQEPLTSSKREATDINEETGELIYREEDDFGDYLITAPEDVVKILSWARKEVDRRNKMFSSAAEKGILISNINEYNAHYWKGNVLPRYFVVLDELPVAIMEFSAAEKKDILKNLSGVARLGRSAGIHLILGSQVGNAEVLGPSISGNVGTRLSGFCATGPQSQTIMNSWIANRILNNPGRMAYKDDFTELELQTPWISPKLAGELVKKAVEKWGDGHDEDIVVQTVFLHCLNKHDGAVVSTEIHKDFPEDEDITVRRVQEICQAYEFNEAEEGPEITLNEQVYYLLPAVPAQKKPRRLVLKETWQRLKQNTKAVEPVKEPEPELSVSEVFQWVLQHNNGDYSIRNTYEKFKEDGLSWHKTVNLGQEYEGKPIEIEGETYILTPQPGRNPRKLVLHVSNFKKQETNGANLTDPSPSLSEETALTPLPSLDWVPAEDEPALAGEVVTE